MKPELQTVLRLAWGGRVVIPAQVRERLGLKVGNELILTVEDDHAILMNVKTARCQARRQVARYVPSKISLSEELRTERKKEAERE